ncbi:unnamed protein product [Spirodela intermedia]|uniref:Uncharacterized protein n=1 Tax=Spirodela intermedia TaxID=51605 RepID=A0A7I8JB33_SPIIN|nr:unnamed protein product [Spirodela intermedia]CAA6667428.1 unnamed protein product [Spirodela intermedia]
MERMLRSRDHILFGHASLFRLSSEEEGDVSRRSTDVDFSDVFGGPPRTSSGFEGRHGFSESIDGYLSRVRGDGVYLSRRESRLRGTGSPGHRKHLTNEFFGDVFKGNESVSSSPRRTDGPSASSASSAGRSVPPILRRPQSTASVEAHLLPRKPEPPKKCQPPFHLQDSSTPPAPNSPQTPLEAIKLDRSGASETEQGYKEDSGRSSHSGGGHFHFSIYKWASTEIALVMPHNLKNRNKSASRVCGGSAKNLQGATPLVDRWTNKAFSSCDSGRPRTGLANNVKDFIKIFNNEASQRPTAKFESQTQKILSHANCPAYPEYVGASTSREDSETNALDVSFCNIDEEYLENIDGCLVEELSQNQNKVSEADVYREKIQASDAKIREWSKGKEGNIRSLLSTLQYVLWPGSGWKAVPLVDIIEAAAVRRAYQKALLCLHPDKLQQKCTEMHHKYVAEKVFDILQDAWTHFTSLSSL